MPGNVYTEEINAMRNLTICSAIAATLVLAVACLYAQEIVATPDPVGGEVVESVAPMETESVQQADQWRYRWSGGHWWYWTHQNRWMLYSDDRKWVEYDASPAPLPVAPRTAVPTPYRGAYYPAPGYYDHPGPRTWRGYYPGVAVGVAPYGRVGVGVGRRVGVDVWGPHGAVRVGRIHVGW